MGFRQMPSPSNSSFFSSSTPTFFQILVIFLQEPYSPNQLCKTLSTTTMPLFRLQPWYFARRGAQCQASSRGYCWQERRVWWLENMDAQEWASSLQGCSQRKTFTRWEPQAYTLCCCQWRPSGSLAGILVFLVSLLVDTIVSVVDYVHFGLLSL